MSDRPPLTPFTPAQRRLFVLLSAATFFEGYDFIAITQVLPHLRVEMGLSPAQAGQLVGFINIGTLLAWGLVRQMDRVGRRPVMMITLLGYTLASVASGLSPGVISFAAFQLLARIFLIGEWATAMVYAAEVFPADRRGMAIGVIQAVASLGAVICAAITPALIATPMGWRTVYLVGGIPLLLLILARRNLPETDRWKEQVAQGPQPKRPVAAILRGEHRAQVLLLALIWALTYVGTQSGITFWKTFAVEERGFTDAMVGHSLTIAALVALPAVFGVGKLLDLVGRKRGAAIIFPVSAIAVFAAFTLDSPVGLTIALAGVIFGGSGVLPVLNAFTAELFPTAVRGEAFAWANNILGRLGMVLSPPAVGALAGSLGWGPAVAGTGVALLMALGLILALLPETQGRELEEIAAT